MPDNFELDPLLDTSPRARLKRLVKRVVNTRYLFIALLIHVIALALLGGRVVFEAIQLKGDFKSDGVLVGGSPSLPTPPSIPQKQIDVTVSVQPLDKRATETIATQKSSATFNVRPLDIPVVVTEQVSIKTDKAETAKHEGLEKMDIARLQQIRKFHRAGVTGENNKPGATNKGKKTVAKFKCYVAQYQGGDWNCNLGRVADGRWYGNCIYNLMTQIERWTQGRIKPELKPEALKLSSREWLDNIKPPFIFMTGHNDFIFIPAEVENLRQYLMLGGMLWVDNSLPGRRSLFDMALRREMKKVLPEREFEPIPNSHPVFNSYFNFTEPPTGMNFYKEPVEVIKIEGVEAVVYTLNAYSDLWETGLTPKDEIDSGSDWIPSEKQHINRLGPHYPGNTKYNMYRYQFYRNVNLPSIISSYRFGINIVVYLLTRFQDNFLTLPQGDK